MAPASSHGDAEPSLLKEISHLAPSQSSSHLTQIKAASPFSIPNHHSSLPKQSKHQRTVSSSVSVASYPSATETMETTQTAEPAWTAETTEITEDFENLHITVDLQNMEGVETTKTLESMDITESIETIGNIGTAEALAATDDTKVVNSNAPTERIMIFIDPGTQRKMEKNITPKLTQS